MAKETDAGCTRPSAGPTEKRVQEETGAVVKKKEEQGMIMVGQKAPDFTAPGFQKDGFINVKLSDYLGKWVVLCFYPGDFTFV